MSWQIKQEENATVVVLDSELGIQNAEEFHQAMLPLAGAMAVRVNASAITSVHSSIIQILHALSKAGPDFSITDASEAFRAAEASIGITFPRNNPIGTPARGSEQTPKSYG